MAVFVAQLFAISDTAATLYLVDCLAWKAVGIGWLLCGPVAFLLFVSYRIRSLLNISKTLAFNGSPKHTIMSMRAALRDAPGLTSKAAQCFVFFMDIRFSGGWTKKDAMAKFWGWIMAAYTDKFFLILTWILSKKIFNALNKNWLDGKYNAVAHVTIYSIDVLLYTCFRPFRDNTVNLSQSLAAFTNLAGVLIAALPILLDVDLVPDWLNSQLMILVSTLGTLAMATQAILNPVFLLSGTLFQVTGGVGKALGKCNVGGLVLSLGTALWVRFQKIFMARSKAAAAATVRKAKREQSEANLRALGDTSGAALQISHHSMGLKKGILNPQYMKRYFLLERAVLRWYRIDSLITVDGDEGYDFENSHALGQLQITAACAVVKVGSSKDSIFEKRHGEGFGFVIENGDSGGQRRFMFYQESTRDEVCACVCERCDEHVLPLSPL